MFEGGQFVADLIGQAGADERMGKDREYLQGFLKRKRRARDDCTGLVKHERRLPHSCLHRCIDWSGRLVEPERQLP